MKPDPQLLRASAGRAMRRIAARQALSADWLQRQGLAGMAAALAEEPDDGLPLEPAVLDRLQRWRGAFAAQWLTWQQPWREALALLDKPLVLKGAALNQWLYPEPALRPVGDLDILVPPDARDCARDALEGLGYRAELAVDGDLIMTQQRFTLRSGSRPDCHLDLHWQSSNRSLLASALPHQLLWEHRWEIEAGFAILKPEAAWLHAATHLVGHHAEDPRLKWLLDLHLMWELMGQAERFRLLALAVDRGLAPIADAALALCARQLGTRHTELARQRLLTQHRQPSRHYVSGRPALAQDLLTLPGLLPRLQYLMQLLFPSRQFMDARGFGGHPLGYLRRLAGGVAKALGKTIGSRRSGNVDGWP